MSDRETPDSAKHLENPAPKATDETAENGLSSRFPDLDELQDQIARRIRRNENFLEKFLDEDFNDDEDLGDDEDEDEDGFEEL